MTRGRRPPGANGGERPLADACPCCPSPHTGSVRVPPSTESYWWHLTRRDDGGRRDEGYRSRDDGFRSSRGEGRSAGPPRQQQPDGRGGRGDGGGEGGSSGGLRPYVQRQAQQQRDQRAAQQQQGEDIPIVRPGQGSSTTFFSGKKFADVGASEDVVAALQAVGIARPSHIQVHPCGSSCKVPAAGGSPRRGCAAPPELVAHNQPVLPPCCCQLTHQSFNAAPPPPSATPHPTHARRPPRMAR